MLRREFLQQSAVGFGWLAFASLNARAQPTNTKPAGPQSPLAPRPPHHTARAKRIIFLYMDGGPSQLETFDWKPELARHGQAAGSRYLAPAIPFRPHGDSGLMISDAYPELARHADELCLLNGMQTGNPGHQPAIVALHTGNENFVRPSLGAWVTYGLGSESENLPGFVTIDPIPDKGGALNYGSAFLPAAYQGTRLSSGSRGVPHIAHPRLNARQQRSQLDYLQQLNQELVAKTPEQLDLQGMIAANELAFRMQSAVPETLDLALEPPHIRQLYGIDEADTAKFGTQCLMARRLVEAGVRFIQLTSHGWDHHNRVGEGVLRNARATDRPIAGLIADLKQRDLLRDTLILWGGEFGRGSHEDNPGGRGHNNTGYTMWLAGGGVKGGMRYGATDELGQRSVAGQMDTHDLHATLLHLLGLDHERLTYHYAGRDFRLTDVAGEVAHDILA